jgi:signal transduction histidine kinase
VQLRPEVEVAAEDAQLTSGGIALALSVDDRAQVLADPDQLHRILVNLLRNAREAIDGDAARAGAGTVRVDLRVEEGASLVRVADDGPGLPERAQANLFQPFLGSARRDGTGLGLSISRELAQAHGGDLTLVQTGPAGTVFELRLPGAPEPLPPRPGDRQAANARA